MNSSIAQEPGCLPKGRRKEQDCSHTVHSITATVASHGYKGHYSKTPIHKSDLVLVG